MPTKCQQTIEINYLTIATKNDFPVSLALVHTNLFKFVRNASIFGITHHDQTFLHDFLVLLRLASVPGSKQLQVDWSGRRTTSQRHRK
jgi:hypothetical protein